MALDEPLENDFTFTDRDVTFVVAKNLFEEVKPVTIDFVESSGGSGFKITSNLAAGGGCGEKCAC